MSRARKQSLLIDTPTIGADIEVFLQHSSSKVVVSAEGLIKGTKDEPFKFVDGNNYFATSLDNVMAEFCIPPAKNSREFADSIIFAMGWISGSLPKHLQLLPAPSARIAEMYLQTPTAQLFGCDPDYNAWMQGLMNPRPEACNSNIRSCGGHIHVGYKKVSHEVSMSLIRAMDIFLGLPSILQEPDNDRKSLYGKAGAFRHKTYGVEYRTISNYYASDPKLMAWAYDQTMLAIEFVNNNSNISQEEGEAVIAAINYADKPLAERMCQYFGVKLAA